MGAAENIFDVKPVRPYAAVMPNEAGEMHRVIAITFADSAAAAMRRIRRLYPEHRTDLFGVVPAMSDDIADLLGKNDESTAFIPLTLEEAIARSALIEASILVNIACKRMRKRHRKSTRLAVAGPDAAKPETKAKSIIGPVDPAHPTRIKMIDVERDTAGEPFKTKRTGVKSDRVSTAAEAPAAAAAPADKPITVADLTGVMSAFGETVASAIKSIVAPKAEPAEAEAEAEAEPTEAEVDAADVAINTPKRGRPTKKAKATVAAANRRKVKR